MPSELRLLGGVSLLADGQLVSGAATQPRRVAVLAILADAFPAAVTRDRILGLIWPEQDESGARRLLTQALYEVRRELGGNIVTGAGRDLSLDAAELQVDLVEFRAAVRAGDVERASELYRGSFLDGFHLRDGGEFERWAASVRDGAQRDFRRLLDAAIDRTADAGDLRAAAHWAERSLDVSPHDAAVVLRAMDLFERAGDPGAASRVAGVYERRMREDLELPADESVTRRLGRLGRETPQISLPSVPVPSRAVAASSPTIPARARRASIGWKLVAAASLAVVILAAVQMARKPSREQSALISMQAFEVRGDTSGARVASALMPLIAGNLEGAGGTHVDTSASGDGRALRGVVVATGDQVRIDAELAPRDDGDRPVRASVSGSADSVIVLAERLSLELLPSLYENLRAPSKSETVRRIGRVSVARQFLDGESAYHRAAFDSAYAALVTATQADSSDAFLWYRRAVLAEEAHHIDDADFSARIAEANRKRLSQREERLVHAYAVWRSGDGRTADSLYREILQTDPLDEEAWYQFAEVSYHGGTLFGRSLDAARDPWRRAIALDSNNFPALMHGVRLEARAGNSDAIDALLRRATHVHAREPFLSEARAIASASGGRRSLDADALRLLDSMPDFSIQFVHAIVASFVERPDLAWEAANRLTEPRRPDAVRAEGYAALAELALTQGKSRLATAMLDSLDQRNAVQAAWWRAYFAALPFMPIDAQVSDEAARRLASAPTRTTGAPLYLELSVDASIADLIRRYDLALLAIRGGRPVGTALACGEIQSGPEGVLCGDLEHGLAAEIASRAGRDADALRELESMSMKVPYQLAGRSVYFARTRERYLRAQLLERTGRLDEAYGWYAGVSHAARQDYVYLAPSHLARGRIREKQGDAAGAAMHYRRALEITAAADSDPAGIRRDATDGLRRVQH